MPKPRILISPLDWGLGHATRVIPVIRSFLYRGTEVIIAAAPGPSKDILLEEFPSLRFIDIPGYKMRYTGISWLMPLKFPFMAAKVFINAAKEKKYVEKIVEQEKIDIVVSDQRFGFYSEKAFCVYISHQLCVKMPGGFSFIEMMVSKGLRRAALCFNRLWIPDIPGDNNLTGDLSRRYPLPENHRFIGLLSRFSGREIEHDRQKKDIDLLVMISGPEPQRSYLEKKVLSQTASLEGKIAILLGKPGQKPEKRVNGDLTVYSHLPAKKIKELLVRAKTVVCRGGYTTIMELVSLGCRAVLIPTPGQTEQEYLCRRMAQRKGFVFQAQRKMDIEKAVGLLEDVEAGGIEGRGDNRGLEREVENVISMGFLSYGGKHPPAAPHITIDK